MLVDINDIKLLLWIDTWDTSQDDLITLMYNKAISYIQNYTWLILDKQDITKKYENNGSSILNLDYYPVNSISELSVLIWSNFFDADYDVLTDLEDYKLKFETGEIYIKYASIWWQEYKVIFNVWYDISDLPVDLNDAIIDYTVSSFKESQKVDTNWVKSETVNWDSISYMWKVDQINNIKTTKENISWTLEKYKIVNY